MASLNKQVKFTYTGNLSKTRNKIKQLKTLEKTAFSNKLVQKHCLLIVRWVIAESLPKQYRQLLQPSLIADRRIKLSQSERDIRCKMIIFVSEVFWLASSFVYKQLALMSKQTVCHTYIQHTTTSTYMLYWPRGQLPPPILCELRTYAVFFEFNIHILIDRSSVFVYPVRWFDVVNCCTSNCLYYIYICTTYMHEDDGKCGIWSVDFRLLVITETVQNCLVFLAHHGPMSPELRATELSGVNYKTLSDKPQL